MDPAGRRLKIPVWMLFCPSAKAGRWGGLCHGPSREATEDSRLDAVLPECAEIRISQRPHLGKKALLSLASLLRAALQRHNNWRMRRSRLYVLGSSNLARLGYRPMRALRRMNEAGGLSAWNRSWWRGSMYERSLA